MTTTDIVAVKANNFKALLDKSKNEIERALPKHLTVDRMMRIALTEARKNPELLECEQTSLMGAVIQAAQLGLEPGSALGHCYLIPFNNRKKGMKEVQFIVGYRGMLDLSRRSGACLKVEAYAVYDGDHFDFELGLDAKLKHKPAMPRKPDAKLTHVYAIAELKDGVKQWDVMSFLEVEAIRGRSQSGGSSYSPWATDYEAMAKKTVIRRLFKYLPVSIEIQKAVGLDEAAERGEQDNGSVIEIEGRTVSSQDKAHAFQEQLKAPKPEPVVKPIGKVEKEPILPGTEPMDFASFGAAE